jgi:hypothetical protein
MTPQNSKQKLSPGQARQITRAYAELRSHNLTQSWHPFMTSLWLEHYASVPIQTASQHQSFPQHCIVVGRQYWQLDLSLADCQRWLGKDGDGMWSYLRLLSGQLCRRLNTVGTASRDDWCGELYVKICAKLQTFHPARNGRLSFLPYYLKCTAYASVLQKQLRHRHLVPLPDDLADSEEVSPGMDLSLWQHHLLPTVRRQLHQLKHAADARAYANTMAAIAKANHISVVAEHKRLAVAKQQTLRLLNQACIARHFQPDLKTAGSLGLKTILRGIEW